ncbi:MAG: hypothetical protein SFW67_25830 [Myxococcaceae bacterium]|nr:hypothetical protein [Myxococcaceae bacterium]
MPRPRLFFFNEQPSGALEATFTPTEVTQLGVLGAGVSMALLDLTDARAEVVRRLTRARVPVHAWLLVPREGGYFATHHNAPLVEQAFDAFCAWRARHQLEVSTVGLDFEPDVRELDALMAAPARTLARWLTSRSRGRALDAALGAYRALVRRIQGLGFRVETYQFPFVVDDRHAGTRFWQRTLGVLDVEADRQVLMLYTSLMGALGPGLLEQYAPRAGAIGVGSTGGGIDPFPKLSFPELERDLVVAARHAPDVYVFSLEGLVQQAATDALISIEWDRPVVRSASHRLAATVAARVLGGLARLG